MFPVCSGLRTKIHRCPYQGESSVKHQDRPEFQQRAWCRPCVVTFPLTRHKGLTIVVTGQQALPASRKTSDGEVNFLGKQSCLSTKTKLFVSLRMKLLVNSNRFNVHSAWFIGTQLALHDH